MKKKKKQPTDTVAPEARVYRYGARPPLEEDLAREQFRLAHRYRNVLVEAERTRRKETDEALARLSPDLARVEAAIGEHAREADPEAGTPASPATGLLLQLEQAAAEARKARIKARGRPKDPASPLPGIRAQLRDLGAQRKKLRADLFASPAWRDEQEAISARANEREKRDRAAISAEGLYWGTYLAVEQAADAFRKGAPPRYRAWGLRKDRLAVQIQGGMTVADLLRGQDTRLRIVREDRAPRLCDGCRAKARRAKRGQPEPRDARSCTCASLPPASPRRSEHATLWMRVGTKPEGRDPVWIHVPIALHRLPPETARVKWAYLIRRTVGVHDEWSVHLVLQADAGAWSPRRELRAPEGSAVGIDVGWRIREDGSLRVAVWSGSDGREGEIALPAWWLKEQRRVELIRSERDKLMDQTRDALCAWLKDREGLPDWLAEARKTLPSWRSAARLAALALRWRREPFSGGEEARAPLEAWRMRDRHLLTFESHLRVQLQRSRRDLYRVAAARLSLIYREAIVEDMDLREWHEEAPVEDGATAADDAVTRYLRDACLHELRAALGGRMEVRTIEAAMTTMTCCLCGYVHTNSVGPARLFCCVGCDGRWDQDVNAARNILRVGGASGPVIAPSSPSLAPVNVWTYPAGPNRRRRETESKWAAAREERLETASEAAR